MSIVLCSLSTCCRALPCWSLNSRLLLLFSFVVLTSITTPGLSDLGVDLRVDRLCVCLSRFPRLHSHWCIWRKGRGEESEEEWRKEKRKEERKKNRKHSAINENWLWIPVSCQLILFFLPVIPRDRPLCPVVIRQLYWRYACTLLPPFSLLCIFKFISYWLSIPTLLPDLVCLASDR